ncbi:hypothetical protein ACMBCN_01015, partial [Candidatus Liberibacter asiaticus]|nr:hypothetical protein [Candidatus Liberibacter asiaticus]
FVRAAAGVVLFHMYSPKFIYATIGKNLCRSTPLIQENGQLVNSNFIQIFFSKVPSLSLIFSQTIIHFLFFFYFFIFFILFI